MSDQGLNLVAIVVGSGGVLGGIVALLKLRPDTARTTVSAAEGAVIVQSGVILSLRQENERLRAQCAELTKAIDAIDERRVKREREQEREQDEARDDRDSGEWEREESEH